MTREEINTAIRQCLGEAFTSKAPATAIIHSIQSLQARGAELRDIQNVSRTAMRILAAIYTTGHDQSSNTLSHS